MNLSFIDLISEYDNICLFRHEYPDPDALGSQFGLKELILNNFNDKKVYALGENNETLNGILFPEMDKVSDDIIEKSLIVVLDCANSARIDDQRYALGKMIVKIDHHPIVESYGHLNFEQVNACSTSYMIAKFAKTCSLKMNSTTATYLYAGLVADTGRFLHSNTDTSTFEIASYLLENDAKISEVYDKMYSRSIEEIRLSGYILDNFKVTSNGVGYFILEEKTYLDYGLSFEKAKEFVNTLAGIKGIHIWVQATYNPHSQHYNVSVRSKKYVINGIAANYGGGGHMYASGIKVSTIDRINLILNDLNELITAK